MGDDRTHWGGHGTPRGDGSYHFTLWRADGDGGKGERLSWDQGSPVQNLHYTDQNTNTHSSYPSDWRSAEDMLSGGCMLLLALPLIGSVLAVAGLLAVVL